MLPRTPRSANTSTLASVELATGRSPTTITRRECPGRFSARPENTIEDGYTRRHSSITVVHAHCDPADLTRAAISSALADRLWRSDQRPKSLRWTTSWAWAITRASPAPHGGWGAHRTPAGAGSRPSPEWPCRQFRFDHPCTASASSPTNALFATNGISAFRRATRLRAAIPTPSWNFLRALIVWRCHGPGGNHVRIAGSAAPRWPTSQCDRESRPAEF